MGLEARKWTYSLLTVRAWKKKQQWGLSGEEWGADPAESVNEREEEFEEERIYIFAKRSKTQHKFFGSEILGKEILLYLVVHEAKF